MTTVPTPMTQPLCLRRPALRHFCLRARLARSILAQVTQRVPVDIVMPDGTLIDGGVRRADHPAIQIVRPTALFERLAHHPKIGIGEAYMAGDWKAAEGTDLVDVLMPFAERMTTAVPPWLLSLRGVVDRRIPTTQRNSLLGSRRNIEAHYDLSNELFATFLDETMSYSSALFDDGLPVETQDFEEAQLRKVHAILDMAKVGQDTRLLEIGTGWGTLALEAARRGAVVTSVTLSREQAALARERVADAGFSDRVDIRIQDYREVEGEFDAVVSVEMIEAVGEEYWATYFRTIDERLAPGGIAAVQAILMSHERLLATKHSYGWIQKHIFPGGLIPSLQAISETTDAATTLQITGVDAFGTDYAETLRRWRETFLARWPEVNALGFDETFRRRWEFYLAYCQAGFATGYLDVAQVRFERGGTAAAVA
ncbi:MAG TPA: cyclopropane-fatty-acyl-phospholipid synthase family protein [Humibacillus xanthopallidus]|nr:cyclopropane-fatty-acyl-phospholipid synthase family protein [Humibacillus xanthopallidus]